jgi:hypothetical protein
MFLLVLPVEILLYGVQVGCIGQPRAAWGCGLEADELQHAQTVIIIACAISIIGGVAGLWASWTEDEDAARAVWLVLIVGSFAVALLNLRGGFFGVTGGTAFKAVGISLFWPVMYVVAYYFAWIKGNLSHR